MNPAIYAFKCGCRMPLRYNGEFTGQRQRSDEMTDTTKDAGNARLEDATTSAQSVCNGLLCEDCGSTFLRSKKYLSETWRNDPIFKWKSKKCDGCVEKRIDSALDKLPDILNALAT